MSPAVIDANNDYDSPSDKESPPRHYPEPLRLAGALDHFTQEETTPVIGREFIGVNIVNDLLNAENADERLRDLAITSMVESQPPCQ
jgi:hypothetical protein